MEGIFACNFLLKTFDDFHRFANVRELKETFKDCINLQSITLPDSILRICRYAFGGCTRLASIRISTDSIPELEEDAFEHQVQTIGYKFRIYVPKKLCKRYRERWAQYADYIEMDYQEDYSQDDLMVINTTKENDLATALGLKMEVANESTGIFSRIDLPDEYSYITNLKGRYNHIRRLKVVGPISGHDLAVLRFLAGWCPWANTRNYAGRLEYLDLYDAVLKPSGAWASRDKGFPVVGVAIVENENVLPTYSFLKAYNLKTLILPKTCTTIDTRAMQECEGLEVLVVGDSCTSFNWNALDDDAMLTRLYMLSKQKPTIELQDWINRTFSNNYSPTFDAIYVRPSIYEQYMRDLDYSGPEWQRTNLISKGLFNDDESFCSFAAHAAASQDDIAGLNDVTGWFDSHKELKSLVPLRYSAVKHISAPTLAGLTKLEEISLPPTLDELDDNVFEHASNLRYVDFLLCDSTGFVDGLRDGGLKKIGINTQQTLVYVPANYGDTNETNVITVLSGKTAESTESDEGATATAPSGFAAGTAAPYLHDAAYRMVDTLSYLVPYPSWPTRSRTAVPCPPQPSPTPSVCPTR